MAPMEPRKKGSHWAALSGFSSFSSGPADHPIMDSHTQHHGPGAGDIPLQVLPDRDPACESCERLPPWLQLQQIEFRTGLCRDAVGLWCIISTPSLQK